MKLKIFTEAGFEKGMGHFVRMSSLVVKAIKRDIQTVLYVNCDERENKLFSQIKLEFINWIENDHILDMIDKEDFLVIDSYYITLDLLNKIKTKSGALYVIDDNMRLEYSNMNILNPNYFGEFLKYSDKNGNNNYIGAEYTLLRESFNNVPKRKINLNPKRILLTMGGTDCTGITYKTVLAIKKINIKIKLIVVVTSINKDIEKLQNILSENDELLVDIDEKRMSLEMTNCDFAFATAGGTSNELLKMKCPASLIPIADNQMNNIKYLSDNKLCEIFYLNNTETITKMFEFKVRNRLYNNLKKISFEKNGTDFLIERFFDFKSGGENYIRK